MTMKHNFHIVGIPNEQPDMDKLVAALLTLATELVAEEASDGQSPAETPEGADD